MCETAPYQLASRFEEDVGAALKTKNRAALTDADDAGSAQLFALLASQADDLAESSRFLANAQDPFAQEDANPLTANASHDPVFNPSPASKGAEQVLSTPPTNTANSNPQNLAGAGQGPGGASTTNPSGGGSSGGGGSANLHLPSQTQLQQPAPGANDNRATAASPAPAAALTAAGAANGATGSGSGSVGSGSVGTSADGKETSFTLTSRSGSGSGSGSWGTGNMAMSHPFISSGSGGTGSGSGSGGQLTATGTTFYTSEGYTLDSAFPSPDSPLIQATAGTAVNNVPVATFYDEDPNGVSGDFTATINWGDNTPTTTGTITALSGGGFDVSGSHVYTASGTYSVQATIVDAEAQQITYPASTMAVVQDAPITASPATIEAAEGSPLNNATVASFTSANPYALASSFSATIDWGDGSPLDTGTISGSNGNFTVTGSHTYSEGGSYQVSVTITSQGGGLQVSGSSAAVASSATVTDLPLTAGQTTLTPALTGSNTTLTATFTDANTGEDPSNYMAQIDWGDGWIDDAAVSGSGGSYSLTGSHVYDHPGNYSVIVTVTDAGGSTLTQSGNVTITAAALSASGSSLTATAGQALSNAQITSFTDGNTDNMNDWYGPASGYTATVDWGDGTGLDSSPTVNGDDDGFYVIGNHTYSSAGAYTATVTITNADGASTTTTSTLDVTTITPTGATINGSEGGALNNATVATFTDTQTDTYTASIDWGDGSVTSGTISGSGGSYSVLGSHTYADGGTYPVTVTITNSEGLNAIAASTANVTDAALTATPQPVTIPENSPLNNVLATFTDANPNDSLSSYSASIDWGDGSPTDVGTIAYANGIYTVTGTHTYTSEGSFTATVYIGDDGGATTTASVPVSVTAPIINASAVSLSAQEQVALNNVTVATFTAPGSASDYSATIDWGDGNTSTGTISGSGTFTVTGSNTYMEPTDGQQFLITVTITDTAGDTATALSSATVDGGTLSASAATVQPTEGISDTFTFANFTDTDPGYSAGEYTATIDYGDGSPVDVATITGSNGVFSVTATHTYLEEGSYTAQVTITDPNGIVAPTVSVPVSVQDAAVSVGSMLSPMEVATGELLNGLTVATFTDANPYSMPSDFTATIDWGDGGSSNGSINGFGGAFSISGSHTYANAGDYNLTVTLTDDGGQQSQMSYSMVAVTPVPLYQVATFSDSNPNDPASAFSATIDWGDGSPTSSGTISGGGGYFTVTGEHIYDEEGPPPQEQYTVTVTISGPGGPATALTTAQVSDAPVVGSQSPPAPPQAPPPAASVPEIKMSLNPPAGMGVIGIAAFAALAGTAKVPLRIHIDDDFDMHFTFPFQNTTLLADNQGYSINPAVDSDLVQGTITIGPANSKGTLTWTIPPSVRVWWQPTQGGPWQLIKSGNNLQYMATGQPIPIAIQGMTPASGSPPPKITVTYQLPNATASKNYFYNVYTGLQVLGTKQDNLVQQLKAASDYTFTVDANGNVWRASKELPLYYGSLVSSYQQRFRQYLNAILENKDYAAYNVERSTMHITAAPVPIIAPAWVFDQQEVQTIYPDNIASVKTSPGMGKDGPLYAAGIIIHVLQEFFERQIYGMKMVADEDPKIVYDHDHGGAFGLGVRAEEAVLAWGNRGTMNGGVPISDPDSKLKLVQTAYYSNKGATLVTIKLNNDATESFNSASLKPPGR